MNANEVSPKANARLNRIKKVSKCLRLILQYGIPLWIVFGLALSTLAIGYGVKVPFLSHASHPSETHSHTDLSIWSSLYGCIQLVVFLFWYRTVMKLFGFFEKGILFTAETVRCIQTLGSIYIAGFLLALVFHFLLQDAEHWLLWSGISGPFTGFFIIFIGWLIDEARKIREEQELTV
jgi:Protein of unknown function (DUF2975)